MPGMLNSAGRKLLSGSVLRLCNLFFTAASAFFLMPFIVHHLGDRLYGFWTLAGAFVGYYGLLDFGLSGAVSQYMSLAIGKRDAKECCSVFNAALRIQLFIGSIALIVTLLLALITPWFSKTQADAATFSKVIAILGFSMALSFPARVYGGLLEAQLRFDIQSALGMLGVALKTGLSIWAILRGHGLLSLAWITLIANLPVIALQVLFAKREATWARIGRSPVDRTMVKSFFSYSIYTFMSFLGDMLRFQVDALVIAGMIGLAAVTHYRVAGVFASYYTSIICCITGMLQPVLSRLYGAKDQPNLEKVFFFATKVSLSSSLFIGGGLVCWGAPFIARWMGPTYKDAYWPLVALAIAVLLDVGQNPSISLLYATFKHRFYTYMNSAEGVLNLGISLALARPLGTLGVAIGTLVAAFIIRAIVQPYAVCKACNLDYRHYMKFIAISLLRCLALLSVAVIVVTWGIRPSYLWLFGSAICATLIYATGTWRFVFSSSEREQLRTLIGSRASLKTEVSHVEVSTF